MCFLRLRNKNLLIRFVDGSSRHVLSKRKTRLEVVAENPNVDLKYKHKNLVYSWKCTFNDTGKRCTEIENYLVRGKEFLDIPEDTLKNMTKYKFTVTVHSEELGRNFDAEATQEVLVGTLPTFSLCCGSCIRGDMGLPFQMNQILIRGLNCEGRPLREVDTYIWEYREGTNGKFQSVDSLRAEEQTSKFVLRIKKNSLQLGKNYQFRVTEKDNTLDGASLTFIFTTPPINQDFKTFYCIPTPKSGIRGVTDFQPNCHHSITGYRYYEMYDKYSEEDILFDVRMVWSNIASENKATKLTRGLVTVFAYDKNFIIYQGGKIEFSLSPFNGNLNTIRNYLIDAERAYNDKTSLWDKVMSSFNILSIAADLLEKKMNPDRKIIRKFFYFVEEKMTTYDSSSVMKMQLSTLYIILSSTDLVYENWDLDLPFAASKILFKITDVCVATRINWMKYYEDNTKYTYLQMVSMIINCAEKILKHMGYEAIESGEGEYVEPSVMEMIQDTSSNVVKTLLALREPLESLQVLGDAPEIFESSDGYIVTQIKVDYVYELSNWTMHDERTSVVIPMILAKSVSQNNSTVTELQYLFIRVNPFFYHINGIPIVTGLLFVCYRLQKKPSVYQDLTNLNNPIQLHLGITDSLDFLHIFEGTTYQLNASKLNMTEYDTGVPVYKVFIPPRAKAVVKFVFDDSKNFKRDVHDKEFRVVFLEDLRPDYDAVVKRSMVINANSPNYNFVYDYTSSKEKLYYMGILPGINVPVGEKVVFRLQASYTSCLTWDGRKWNSECWVGIKTNLSSIQCDCQDISNPVAGAMSLLEYKFEPLPKTITLFLTPSGNLLPLITLFIIILVYILLLIFAIYRDKRDVLESKVIILRDNYPAERYCYLVGVYTGARFKASTTAVVGIRLFGEKGESRSHTLVCEDRRVLRSFSDDWFLIYSPQKLGKITKIQVWHNNAGWSPDWYLDKIEVYDVKYKLRYMFVVKDWISADIKWSPEVTVLPSSASDYFNIKQLFDVNLVYGLRDKNMYASIFIKHPRDPVTRVQRLNAVLVFVLVAMAVCLLLFVIYFNPGSIKEDLFQFELIHVDLIIFILTYIIALVCAAVILKLFRKSVSIHYQVYMKQSEGRATKFSQMPTSLEDHDDDSISLSPYIDESEIRYYQRLKNTFLEESYRKLQVQTKPKHKRKTYENLVVAVHKLYRTQPLLPLKLPQYKSGAEILDYYNYYNYTAWTLTVIFILLAVIIVLAIGWRLPTVKTEHFLAVLVAVVLIDIVLVSVIVAILSAAILSIMYQNVLPETTYNIVAKDGNRKEMFGNRDYLGNLIKARKSPVYFPANETMKIEMRRKALRMYRWKLLAHFIILLVVFRVLFLVVSLHYEDRYNSNYYATVTMTGIRRIPGEATFTEVFNRTLYFEFLEFNYVESVYKYLLLHKKELEKRVQSTASNTIWRMGNIRCRQLRVLPNICGGENFFGNDTKPCAPKWSPRVEDQDLYGEDWSVASYKDITTKSNTWKWVSPKYSNSSHFYGLSGTLYHAGGYLADLKYTKRDTKDSITYLKDNHWLDHMTRALFLELTLYNANTDLFTQVVLVTEQTPFGEYISLPKVVTVSRNIGFNMWNLSFMVILVYLLTRILLKINKNGLFVYISTLPGKFEILTCLVGFGALIVYTLHVIFSTNYINVFYRSGLDQYFNFFKIYRFDYFSMFFFCLFLSCIIINVLVDWRFGKIFFCFYNTLTHLYKGTIIFLIYLTIVLVIIWRFIGYRINVYLYSHYTIFVMYYKHFKIITVEGGTLTPFIVYMSCAISGVVMFLLMTAYASLYRFAKKECIKYKLYDDFNYLQFVKEEITIFIKFMFRNIHIDPKIIEILNYDVNKFLK